MWQVTILGQGGRKVYKCQALYECWKHIQDYVESYDMDSADIKYLK